MLRLPFAKALRVKSRDAQRFSSAARKPAPFEEKKNAKSAEPSKSIRGAIEVRCEEEG